MRRIIFYISAALGPLFVTQGLLSSGFLPPSYAWGGGFIAAFILAFGLFCFSPPSKSGYSEIDSSTSPGPDRSDAGLNEGGFSAERIVAEFNSRPAFSLFDSLPWGFFVVDSAGKILSINQRAEALLTLPPKAANINQSLFLTKAVGGEQLLEPQNKKWQTLEIYLPTSLDLLDVLIAADHLFCFVIADWPGTGLRSALLFSADEAKKASANGDHQLLLPGALSYAAAHRLNNDLAAILGYVELIQTDLPPQARESADYYLETIFKTISRARDLIRRDLPQGSGAAAPLAPTSMRSFLNEVVRLLKVNPPKVLSIKLSQPSGSFPEVLMNTMRVHQAVIYIYHQLIMALMPQGGQIRLSFKRGPAHQDYLNYQVLIIEAGGPGLRSGTKIDLDSLNDQGADFEKMFTPPAGWESPLSGSDDSNGALLHLELFFSEAGMGAAVDLGAEASVSTSTGQKASIKKQLKILFVDDEVSLAEIGHKTLTRIGHWVTSVTNSQAALDLLQSRAGYFDLLITDQTMPGLTGLELAEAALRCQPQLRILLFTGFLSTHLQEKAKQLGIEQVFLKPLNSREVAAAIDSLSFD